MPTDPRHVFRDATYSAETQEHLRALLNWLTRLPLSEQLSEHATSLADVIERWDANDATEVVLGDV